MSYQIGRNYSDSSFSLMPEGGGGGGVGIILVGVAGIAAIIDLFVIAPAFGFALLFFVLFVGTLLGIANRRKLRRRVLVNLLMCASVVAACIGGVAVFNFQAIPVSQVIWLVAGLYIAALAMGALMVLSAVMRLLAILAAVGMVTAAMLLSGGPGESASNSGEEWKIILHVSDERGNPLPGALADCVALTVENPDAAEMSFAFPNHTDANGIAEFTFQTRSRVNGAVCASRKRSQGSMPDYQMRTTQMATPLRGGVYHLEIRLRPSN